MSDVRVGLFWGADFEYNPCGPVAQGLEQNAHNVLAAGSNPAGPTIVFLLSLKELSQYYL